MNPELSARRAVFEEISRWRPLYREEMNCQIVHDSLHLRPGWSREYVLSLGSAEVGYGSVAEAGPWKGKPAIYEFFLMPEARMRAFDLFQALLDAADAVTIETQSNDPLLTVMAHAFANRVTTDAILFRDAITTAHSAEGIVFRAATPEDGEKLAARELDPAAGWLVEVEGVIAGAGGVLYHYNPPYGDVYMKVAAAFRRRGFGAYLVQELKRVCREQGSLPAARCNPTNLASRRTLQKAGFVPCGVILVGDLQARQSHPAS